MFLRCGDGNATDALHLHRLRGRIAPVKPPGPNRSRARHHHPPGRRSDDAGRKGPRFVKHHRAVNDVDAGGYAASRYPVGELALLPGKQRNPRGTRSLTLSSLSTVHRGWVDGLPPLLVADETEFDKAAVVLCAYRHSYAQRHADVGTPPDVSARTDGA